jgi:FkbM family methyltransferase
MSEINDSDTVLDIGANVGIYSLFAGQIASEVISIEPHSVNISRLAVNSHLNSSDINIFQCAFSDSQGYIGLGVDTESAQVDGTAALNEFSSTSPTEEINVRIESGDKFVRQNGISTPNVIKIDVQGAEKKIIDGFRSTLSNRDCRIVYCEVHENHVDTNNIKREFESMGFDIRTLERETDTIKAVR